MPAANLVPSKAAARAAKDPDDLSPSTSVSLPPVCESTMTSVRPSSIFSGERGEPRPQRLRRVRTISHVRWISTGPVACPLATFRSASRSWQRSELGQHPREQQLAETAATPARYSMWISRSRSGICPRMRAISSDRAEFHRVLRSSGTSRNFRISLASLNSPPDGSPVARTRWRPHSQAGGRAPQPGRSRRWRSGIPPPRPRPRRRRRKRTVERHSRSLQTSPLRLLCTGSRPRA